MGSKILLQLGFVVFLAVLVNAYPESATEARATCNNACGSVSEPMCANNGITYANSCRFTCAKKYNNRLKFIKAGSCAGTSLKEYRGQASRPTPPPSRYPTNPSSSSSHDSLSGWRSLFRF